METEANLHYSLAKIIKFNGFTKWLFFGGDGIIAENHRERQRKIIKYNHLIANCVIFYNVFQLTSYPA
ncbi:Tn3 family transposase [Paenibacillus sp. 102]|uniref:Tn3 family transposase n=1 Tax=Paenibacillus sp. 102 TaxID=3120823 RepID=UPI0031BA8520